MGSTDQDIGYIKGKVENYGHRLKIQEKKLNEINTKLNEISSQLGFYRHIIVFTRSILWVGLIIITLKFGDVQNMWSKG